MPQTLSLLQMTQKQSQSSILPLKIYAYTDHSNVWCFETTTTTTTTPTDSNNNNNTFV